ncbi:MAG: DNA polymerase Y family protein [Xanthobacteraceae bacterium]|nr:DNA polymerase Y family protein [Xanthobacteraceae bacterium]
MKRRSARHGDAPDDEVACVVVARDHNARVISALNDAAARLGLEVGTPLTSARAICPDIAAFDADGAADTQTLNDIADWCDRFTPLVALDPPHGLLLDIGGCAHLFGGEASMLRTICGSLRRQGFVVSAAIAGTPACARTLTRGRSGCVVPDGQEAAAVAALPVFTLDADDAITRGLRRAGLKTIGDVAARGRHEIAARFGATFVALLEQALGTRDAPISPRKPAPDYIVERRFAEPVATDTVIVLTLSALARTLIERMGRDGKGARHLEASFFRADGRLRRIGVETGLPVTRDDIVARLFRERLEALADPLDPGFGFDLIRLSAVRADDVLQTQRDLDAHVHDSDEVAALIDRIAARIGGDRIAVHLPRDTHIPERAAFTVPAQSHLAAAAVAAWPARAEGEPPLRPLRLFAPPEPVEVLADFPHGPPAAFRWRRVFHRLARVEGPERIAAEWWQRHDCEEPTRDYFRAEDAEGARFWLYREGIHRREVTSFRWFLHGLFA